MAPDAEVRARRADRPARRAAAAAALTAPPCAHAAPRASPLSTRRDHPRRQVHALQCERLLDRRARAYAAPISGTCALLHVLGTLDALGVMYGALSTDMLGARALGGRVDGASLQRARLGAARAPRRPIPATAGGGARRARRARRALALAVARRAGLPSSSRVAPASGPPRRPPPRVSRAAAPEAEAAARAPSPGRGDAESAHSRRRARV